MSDPYRIKLWYPSTVDFADADYSLEMKAPEIGNTEQHARNQTFARSRSGNTYVYDRGVNFNQIKKFEFRQIKDVERAALLIFLEAVGWGASRLKYEHYTGEEYIIRVASTQLETKDTGYAVREAASPIILWDFNLEVLDLTNNDDALGDNPPMSNPLALHLLDYNHPHNPAASVVVNIADGAKVVETLSTRSWKAATWIAVAEKNGARLYSIIHAAHNGYSTTDATTIQGPVIETLADIGGVSGIISFSVDLSGTGTNQVMRLKAASTADGYTVRVRRIKL